MAYITWDSSLSVGVNSMDLEHQRLIKLLGDFYDSVQKKEGKEKLESVIKGLKDYTVIHFANEERLMKQHDYPDYAYQKKEHDEFIKVVQGYEDRFKAGKMLLTVEVTNFMQNWITKHIQEADKKYAKFFTEKGVK